LFKLTRHRDSAVNPQHSKFYCEHGLHVILSGIISGHHSMRLLEVSVGTLANMASTATVCGSLNDKELVERIMVVIVCTIMWLIVIAGIILFRQ